MDMYDLVNVNVGACFVTIDVIVCRLTQLHVVYMYNVCNSLKRKSGLEFNKC